MLHSRWTMALSLGLFVGCGGPVADYSQVELVQGTGQITLDEQPLASAVVTFEDPTDDTCAYALTDASGHYTLQFDSEMKGVKTGKKIVRISTTRKILGLNCKAGQEEDRRPDRQGEKVPDRYNRKSELRVEVMQSSGPFDFALTTREMDKAR